MRTMLRHFVVDDGAQDLVEYSLLGGLVGIIGIVAWANVGLAINNTYISWDTGVQGLSDMPPPGGGGS
jgi:hypothetical protein